MSVNAPIASSQAPDDNRQTQAALPRSNSVPVVSAPSRKTKLHHFSPKEVAEELSLMDAELLRKIAPEELENGAWMKKDKLSLAPNVLAMVHASNDLAMLVPTEILSELTTHAMAKCISTYIKIAGKCYRLKNFNSLKAILAGLQCTPIYRLKKTWKEVPTKRKKKFETLSGLMSEEHNWKAYSTHLEDILDKNTPCVPFLGVLLTMIVQYESVHAMHESTSRFRRPSRSSRVKKVSGVEDYTVLEAITVRNRLESIRKRSSSWRMSLPSLENQITSLHDRQVSYQDNQSTTIPELENSRPRANALILLDEDSDSDTSYGEKTVTMATILEDTWVCENGDDKRLSLRSSLSGDHSDDTSSSSTHYAEQYSADDELVGSKSPGVCAPSVTKDSVSQIDAQVSAKNDHDNDASTTIETIETKCEQLEHIPRHFSQESQHKHQSRKLDKDSNLDTSYEELTVTLTDDWITICENGDDKRLSLLSSLSGDHSDETFSSSTDDTEQYSADDELMGNKSSEACAPSMTKVSVSQIDVQLSGQDDHEDAVSSGNTNTEHRVKSHFDVLFLRHNDHDNTSAAAGTEHTIVSRSNTVHIRGHYSHEARHKKTRSRKLSEIIISFGSDDEIVYTSGKAGENSEHLPREVGLTPSRSYDGLLDACTKWNFDEEENHFLNPVVAATSLDNLHTVSNTSISTTGSSDSSSSQSTSSLLSNIMQNISGSDQDHKDLASSNSRISHPRLSRSSTEFDMPPMRRRSKVVNDLYRTGGSITKAHLSRSSTEIIITPNKQQLGRRRRASPLINVLQASASNLSDPSKLLSRYQLMSFGCSDSIQTNCKLRKILSQAPRNTEGQNYKLSYLKEPV